MTYILNRRKSFRTVDTGIPIIPSLNRWYDASDISTLWQNADRNIAVSSDNDPIGAWDDKSGNNNHLTQSTSTSRPTYKATMHNSMGGVQFITDFLTGSTTIGGSEAGYSIYIAAQLSGYQDWSAIWADGIANSWGNGGVGFVFDNSVGQINFFINDYTANRILYGSTPVSGAFGVLCGVYNKTNLEGYISTVSQGTDAYTGNLTTEDSNVYLGGYNGAGEYDIDILEVIVAEEGHSSSKVSEIVNYLETKWNL